MGNVLPIIGMVTTAVSLFRRPNRDNPTHLAIQYVHQAERVQKRAEESAREAREIAEKVQRQAERDREAARAQQEVAKRSAVRVVEELARMRAQVEEAVIAARHAQGLAEAAANAAREEAAKLAHEAQEQREHARRVREEAERATATAKEDAAKAQKAADERRREADTARVLAEEVARTAAEETRKAVEAREEAERQLKEGIQPVVVPSPEELAAAKQRIQYQKNAFHFAVAGISGSGKSSLVNAFRGLHSLDPGAAAVGVTEQTLEMARYPDPNPENPFVWYDIPGAGTLKCRDWQYFNDQILYVFDCIIVLFDNRFTMTDIAILTNARRFNVPTYIVRSKADQHIRNIMIEKGYASEDDDDASRRNKLYKAAREQFIEETTKSVRANLFDAKLPDQRVYIVASGTLLSIVLKKMPKKTIDEVELLNDLLNQAYSRRLVE